MKPSLIAIVLLTAGLCSCTTLSNRRDMYSPQVVRGPYTRMLETGSYKKHTRTVITTTTTTTSDGKTIIKARQ
ncbi:MAG: hypothetical protein ABIP97_12080 [Chthoniobacterales bacterium]